MVYRYYSRMCSTLIYVTAISDIQMEYLHGEKKFDYNSKNTGHAFVTGFVLAILVENSCI